MTTDAQKTDLSKIAMQFMMNLSALRVFNDRIGAAAIEHDRLAFDTFIDKIKELFPREFPTDSVDSGQSADEANNHDKEEVISASQSEETQSNQAEEIDPTRAMQLVRAAKLLAKAAPMQSTLLLESGLISLMSSLEALVADLIHAFYSQFPDALPADDRTLSLAELRVIGSIEEAEMFLRSKEVDSVLRESLDSQLLYFGKRLKIDLVALAPNKPVLVEVAQRRNLLVHNRGVVNRTYLERVDSTLIEEYAATKDKRLRVSSNYFVAAMNVVEMAGIVLLQQCWRKWRPDDRDSSEGFLVDFTFDALVEERYDAVIEIAKYASAIPFENESRKRRVCINHAIALRDSGRESEVESLLSQYDWSGFQLLFRVALCAVRAQEEHFYQLLPRAIAAGEVTRENLEEWPLFRNFRETAKFTEMLTILPSRLDEEAESELKDDDESAEMVN